VRRGHRTHPAVERLAHHDIFEPVIGPARKAAINVRSQRSGRPRQAAGFAFGLIGMALWSSPRSGPPRNLHVGFMMLLTSKIWFF
jgi:hypothetical protein